MILHFKCRWCGGESFLQGGLNDRCPKCGRKIQASKVVHYFVVKTAEDDCILKTSVREKAEERRRELGDAWIKEVYEELPKKLYTKAERSSFGYWFAHWWAVQRVAWKCDVWSPKFLLHDAEKPWLRLVWPYTRVQQWHRSHRKHHLERALMEGFDAPDYTEMMVDWEAARFSKFDEPLNARETLDYECSKPKYHDYEGELRKRIEPVLDQLGL